MFDPAAAGGPLNASSAFDLLQELERNTPEEIRKQRTHFRLQVKARVTLQAANSSETLTYKIQGTTGDLSEGGCCVLFPVPVRVGDVYRLGFDRAQLDLPLTFARCVRCLLIREDAFEAGFRFFAPVTLPESLSAGVAQSR